MLRTPLPAAAIALLLSGCTTAMELGRARTLERGTWEQGWVVGGSGLGGERRVPQEDARGGMVFLLPIPPPEWWGAWGVAPRLEVDARISLLAAQAGVKAGLLRSERLDLAISAAVVADLLGRWPDGEATRARLALLAGVPLGDRFELDLAPQLSWPLDARIHGPELAGATGTLHCGPLAGGMRRLGLAVSVLRYRAPRPQPGEVAEGTFVGVGVVMSTGGSAGRR